MESASVRIITLPDVKESKKQIDTNISLPTTDWLIALWICIILTVLVLIAMWIITIRNQDGNLELNPNIIYPSAYPYYLIRLFGNTLIIILLAAIAIFISRGQLGFIPLYLILLALIYSCLLIMEISFATNNFGRIAMMAAIAFLISLALWLLIDNPKNSGSSLSYISYLILIIINIYLFYLAYIMFRLYQQN